MSMFATSTPDAEQVRGRWTWFFAAGVLMVILGFVALGNVIAATVVTTIVLGFVLLVAGATQLAGAFTGSKSVGWRIVGALIGLLYIVVGFDLIMEPLKGSITVAWVIAVMLMVGGVLRTFTAISARPQGWGLLVVVGIIDVLLGIWLFTGLPFTAPAIGFFVGFDLIFGGISWIALSLAVRNAPGGSTPTGTAAA